MREEDVHRGTMGEDTNVPLCAPALYFNTDLSKSDVITHLKKRYR